MKILAVNPSACVGGAEQSLLDVLEGLQAREHSVLLAVPAGGKLHEVAAGRGIPTQEWDLPHSLRRVGRHTTPLALLWAVAGTLRAFWSLAVMVQRHHIDVIYSNGVKCHVLSGVLRLFLWRAVVWHARDFVSRRGVGRALFPLSRLAQVPVIANSHAVAREWSTQGNPAIVIHNGFLPKPLRNTERNPAQLQLLTAGVLARWKGFDVVLRACSLLPEEIDWRLTVCGGEIYETDGHRGERERLEQLSKALGIAERVLFTGMVEDLSPYLAASDVLLHGSIKPEPFGRVVAEAMLAGMPVIASAGGGIPEFVRAGIDGLLYPMGDVRVLRDAICRLAGDGEMRMAMGKSARERILVDFGLDAKIDQIEQVLCNSAHVAGEWSKAVTRSCVSER